MMVSLKDEGAIRPVPCGAVPETVVEWSHDSHVIFYQRKAFAVIFVVVLYNYRGTKAGVRGVSFIYLDVELVFVF